MRDANFEWDDTKAEINQRRHGVTFEMARDACNDAFAIVGVDPLQDAREERLALIGIVDNRALFVAYTIRGERTRIISARKAEPHERRRYHDESRQT
jgi:uncharacterized DUF497 family protein